MTAPTAQVTGEITVERCTVTVVRRGGWSWGANPRVLVQQILDMLPDLLATQFAEHLADDGPDVEITTPVTVTVRLGAGVWSGSASAVASPVVVLSSPVVAETASVDVSSE